MKHFNEFSQNDIISYIKTRNLGSVAVFMLDILNPFRRILSSIMTVSSPLLSIFIKAERIEAGISFFENRSIEHLKKKLPEEN